MRTSPSSDLPYGGRLMFTQSWEDPACDRAALRIQPGETVFAITSGGDNVLELLLTDPARIFAIDLNPAQNLLLELKMAAFRRLDHGSLLELFGVRSTSNALRHYGMLRDDLSGDARAYWDSRRDAFSKPLLRYGGFERYHALLRQTLRLVVGDSRMRRVFQLRTEEQGAFYDREWSGPLWRGFMRVACSQRVLGNRLDPSWFAHADGVTSFGQHFTALAQRGIGVIPARTNYFLAQILLGRYLDETQVPEYLRPENFAAIRSRLDRIEWKTADVANALAALPARSVDAFALSNVFEYSPVAVFDRARAEIRRVARAGARVSLRNLLARRRLADDPAFEVDRPLSEKLRLSDRGFMYSTFEAARLSA